MNCAAAHWGLQFIYMERFAKQTSRIHDGLPSIHGVANSWRRLQADENSSLRSSDYIKVLSVVARYT